MDKTPATPTVPIDRLRPYFRELSLSVFSVFQFGCLSRTILDTDANTREQEELRIEPSQLIFLLQDLCNKLSSTFATFGPKVGVVWWAWSGGEGCGFVQVVRGDSMMKFSSGELVETMTELMPALCEHLENTNSYFQVRREGRREGGSE